MGDAKPNPVADVIRRLGGPTEIARSLGLRVQAVSNWSSRNAIPQRHQFRIWCLAVSRGVDWVPANSAGFKLVPGKQTDAEMS